MSQADFVDPDPTIPGYTRNGKPVDLRKNHYTSSRMHNPVIQWGVIIAILGITGTGYTAFGQVKTDLSNVRISSEAFHTQAMVAIEHEKDLRIVTGDNINENVGEVREDVKRLTRQLKQDSDEIQRLLRQLLQQNVNLKLEGN